MVFRATAPCSRRVRILLTGKNGQVGWELQRSLVPLGDVTAVGTQELDLADPDAIRAALHRLAPDVIVNPAAYTAVDQAQREEPLAYAINAIAPGVLADEATRRGALLIHYSTDYVFDGTKAGPYAESDPPNPVSVYGASKLAGERAIQASGCRHVILRTSWVYGARGKNFLLTMLRLARERPELRVVSDQIGAPTWCRALAEATTAVIGKALVDPGTHGLYHATNSGATSWFEFAKEILRAAKLATPVHPIPASAYPTPAVRPANSVLDNTRLLRTLGVALPDWRLSLAQCMREVGNPS